MSARGLRSSVLWLSSAALAWGAGCGQLLGLEETSLAPPDPLVCAEALVPSTLEPTPINTEALADDYTPSCGAAGALDQAIGFTAPVTDYYVFDTFGSGFDTVLALYDQCGGAELACNNNAGMQPQSELVRKLREGERALAVVEGNAGDTGTGALRVSRVTCPDADLEDRTFPVSLNTASFGDDHGGACGGAGQEDRAYHWVAPRDGLYAFRVDSRTFTPTISVVSGPRCSDSQLGCNAAAGGVRHAEVVRRLKAGEPVTLQVDGVDGAGEFAVNISERTAACPEATIDVDGVTNDQLTPRVLAPSCGPVEVPGGVSGSQFELRDKSYAFKMAGVERGCAASCEFELTAAEPMYLYVLEGDDCAGAERSCKLSTQVGSVYKTSATVSAAELRETRHTIVVADSSTVDGQAGPYSIGVQCFGICLTETPGGGKPR